MGYVSVCIALACCGVDYGWQPIAGGGVEYIVQIEPGALDLLSRGHDVVSDIPPHLTNIRTFRLMVGDGPLPHINDAGPQGQPLTDRMVVPAGGVAGATTSGSGLQWLENQNQETGTGPWLSSSPLLRTTTNSGGDTHLWTKDSQVQPAGGAANSTAAPNRLPSETQESPPWMPLVVALLALFASLGANAYLGLLTAGWRSRYRRLLGELKTA